MSGSTFSGRLDYDSSDDYIEVVSFILRDGEIGFTLVSVTAEYRRWTASGTAVRTEGDMFIAQNIYATQMKETSSSPWNLEFQVVHDGDLLIVKGMITDEIEFPFSGSLEPSSAIKEWE